MTTDIDKWVPTQGLWVSEDICDLLNNRKDVLYVFSSLPFEPEASLLIFQTIDLNQIFSIVTLHNIRL